MGPAGDNLNGTGGDDFVVGDNYARGDATGASPDKDIVGLDNADVVIGDSASLQGDARGGAPDRLAGADGNDLVVGDSYAPHGNASGDGNDKSTRINHKAGLNGGPGNDVVVGDNYTKDGTATGGRRDELQSADGGDNNVRCKPGACDDVFYGDNYSAACGPKKTVHRKGQRRRQGRASGRAASCAPNTSPQAQASRSVIQCEATRAPGGAPDRLTPTRATTS